MKKYLLLICIILVCSLIIISSQKSETEQVTQIYVVSTQSQQDFEYDTIHIERATTYNAVSSQCDNNPLTCADGTFIDLNKLKEEEIKYVALSRDLIWNEERQNLFSNQNHWRGPIEFGDTIKIYSESHQNLNGEWIVHDCMNARYSNSIDFLFDPKNNKPKLGIGTDIKIILKK